MFIQTRYTAALRTHISIFVSSIMEPKVVTNSQLAMVRGMPGIKTSLRYIGGYIRKAGSERSGRGRACL